MPRLYVVGKGQAESHHELRRGRDDPGPADLRGHGDQHADEVRRRGPGVQRVGHLPDIRGGRSVECDERGQLDQGGAAWVQTAPRLPLGPQFQAGGQEVVVAPGQATQILLGRLVDVYLGWRGHGQNPFGSNTDGQAHRTAKWNNGGSAGGTASPAGDEAAYDIRLSRCSPTRTALAMAVRAGFTAPMLGKKLVSTTYRLSSSWALQLTSSTDVAGSLPNRQVPAWWAQPAIGMLMFM